MNDDITSGVRKLNTMTAEEKKKEREKRNKNLKELLDVSDLRKLVLELTGEVEYLRKRNNVLETIETQIQMIVEKYKNADRKPVYYDIFVKLNNQLNEEKLIINEEKD